MSGMLRKFLHNTHTWRHVAILGASGYSGQETLDRVLAHPELELVRARLRLARRRAGARARPAPDRGVELPALRRERRRRSPRAPTSSSAASATSGRRRSSRRAGAVVVDLSGAHRLADAARVRASGTASRTRGRTTLGGWSYALPELAPPRRAADREPRLLRDGRAARARRRSSTRSSPASVVVDAKSGVSGAGPRRCKASSHAGAVLENLAPYRVGAHQHEPEIAQAARLRRLLRAAPAAGAARARSRPATRRRPRTTCASGSRPRTRRAPSSRVLPEGAVPELSRVQGTDAAEIGALRRPGHGPRDRHLRARQPRQGRRRARPSRTRTSRSASTRRPGCGSRGCSYERHRARRASSRPACTRASARRSPTSPSLRSTAPAVGAAMFTTNRVQAAPVLVSQGAPRPRPSRRRSSSTPASRTRPPGCAASSTRSRPRPRRRGCSTSHAEQVLVLSTGVIGALLPLEKVTAGLAQAVAGARRRTAARPRPRRS